MLRLWMRMRVSDLTVPLAAPCQSRRAWSASDLTDPAAKGPASGLKKGGPEFPRVPSAGYAFGAKCALAAFTASSLTAHEVFLASAGRAKDVRRNARRRLGSTCSSSASAFGVIVSPPFAFSDFIVNVVYHTSAPHMFGYCKHYPPLSHDCRPQSLTCPIISISNR
jgi:hypothetical protein